MFVHDGPFHTLLLLYRFVAVGWCKDVIPGQAGVFPAVNNTFTSVCATPGNISLEAVNDGVDIAETCLCQQVGCSSGALAGTADQQDRNILALLSRGNDLFDAGNEVRIEPETVGALLVVPGVLRVE